MLNRSLKQPLPFALALIVALLGLMSIVPLATAAQSEPAPTVGEIVVDSYDCETGRLDFHVPVTDLPHIPDSNGSLGYDVNGHYEEGNSGPPGMSFNPEPDDAPYTGDLHFSAPIPATGAESIFPEDASGPIVSIEIYVAVTDEAATESSDSTRMSYPVDCDDSSPDPEPTASTGDDTDDTDSDSAGDSDGSDDITALPETGAATVTTGSEGILLVTFLSSIAAFLGLAALRTRLRA